MFTNQIHHPRISWFPYQSNRYVNAVKFLSVFCPCATQFSYPKLPQFQTTSWKCFIPILEIHVFQFRNYTEQWGKVQLCVCVCVWYIYIYVHIKVKVLPITGHWGPEDEYRYSSTLSWPRHLDGVVSTTPRQLYPRERPGTHCVGGWIDPRVGLDGCGKSRPPSGFDPRTVQPVASRYTDWAIPVYTHTHSVSKILGQTSRLKY